MVFNMVVSSSRAIKRSPVGWPRLSIMLQA
jgi:hypothetical protein